MIAVAAIIVLLPITASRKNSSSPVEYTVLEQGEDINLREADPEILVFTENGTFEPFYRLIHLTRIPQPEPPVVDFRKYSVAFLSYGEQKSTGFSIEIINVYERSSAVTVKTILNTPPENSFQAQKITHPYMMILIPKDSYRRVQLADGTGKLIASANVPERM